MAGWLEGIHRTLDLGLVLIAETAIVQAPPVGPQQVWFTLDIDIETVTSSKETVIDDLAAKGVIFINILSHLNKLPETSKKG